MPNPDDPGAPPAGPGGFPNEIKFHGFIDSFPDGLIGTWVISGRDVEAGAGTDFEPEDGPFEVGACAEVKGTLFPDGTIDTREIETEPDDECEPDDILPRVDLTGVIESLPGTKAAEELVGNWVVGGITVEVLPGTEIEQDKGPIAVGACAEVEGTLLDNGSIDAREVETENASDCDGGSSDDGFFAFVGLVESPPGAAALAAKSGNGSTAGDPISRAKGAALGVWRIGQRAVTVEAGTVFDETGGSLNLGACVEVDGQLLPGGGFTATRVDVLSSSGTCLVPDGIVNAATFQEQSLSPGQIVSVFGLAVGPLDDAALQIRGGRVVSRLGGTRVLFDGVPGAVIFASANQVNVVAPYSLAGKTSTQIQVDRAGGWSNTLTVDVAPSGPGIFTLTQTGVGQAAALNFGLDGLLTLNGPGNRTRRGGIVVIFATGEGLLAPPPEDGEIVGDELPRVQLPVSLTIGGVQAVVTYAGGAPGFVAGFVQINAVVPAGIAAGAAVPVVLSVGGVASPAGATIAVQ